MTQSIQAAIVAAGLVNDDQIPTTETRVKRVSRKPKGRNSHGRTATRRVLTWEHDLFGSLEIATNLNMGQSEQEGPNTWAELFLPDNHPKSILFEVTDDGLAEGTHLLVCNGENDVVDMGSQTLCLEFRVPISYRDDGNPVIHTQAGTGADRDLVLIASNGQFVNYEVSAAVRGGVYAQGQESYGGQFVVIDLDVAQATPGLIYHEVDGKAISVVPLYDENAYPDPDNPKVYSNFLKIIPGAKKVAEYAYRIGAYVSIEDCQPAQWDPQWPELTERLERRRGDLLQSHHGLWVRSVPGWEAVLHSLQRPDRYERGAHLY